MDSSGLHADVPGGTFDLDNLRARRKDSLALALFLPAGVGGSNNFHKHILP